MGFFYTMYFNYWSDKRKVDSLYRASVKFGFKFPHDINL